MATLGSLPHLMPGIARQARRAQLRTCGGGGRATSSTGLSPVADSFRHGSHCTNR
jgi:hypothetical protein